MKKRCILIFLLSISAIVNAQIVTIPDANFKNALVSHLPIIDLNNDGEIQVSEALSFNGALNVYEENINDLTGIEEFVNITSLRCGLNNLTNLDIGALINLEELYCNGNNLTSLNLIALTNLHTLNCKNNAIETLSINGLLNLTYIDCTQNELTNIDVSTNVALSSLQCEFNDLTSIDVSLNSELSLLRCGYNPIMSLDVTENINLNNLSCNSNLLTSLDVTQNVNLAFLYCPFNQISSLDLSNNGGLTFLNCSDNNLSTLLLKNGGSVDPSYLYFQDNFNLNYICVDEEEYDSIIAKVEEYELNDCTVNSYCTFNPGGGFSMFNGSAHFNFNDDNCASDTGFYPQLILEVEDSASNLIGFYYSNSEGELSVPITENTATITPRASNLINYSIAPNSINVDISQGDILQDFCFSAIESINDLEVVLIPINQAIPGFDAKYRLVYTNLGTAAQSGTVYFDFSDNFDEITFINASPIQDNLLDGILSWDYLNLQPFESRQIDVSFNLNTPTDPNFPLNNGDILSYFAEISPLENDDVISNNKSSLRQIVVNSYDPNDKTCLEGEVITPELVGDYVHYLIRFENLGTANATNIVVKDIIDTSKFNISTLIPLHASHNYVTQIRNSNEVEFIFENINLPFDDAINDGYVLFKIKTIETLILGDTFTNDAEIYFDYNFPIITNNYVTTVAERLSVNNFSSGISANIYPNPTPDVLTISSEKVLDSITIYDIDGRVLKTIVYDDSELQKEINLEKLAKGIYFVKLVSGIMENTYKVVKD